MDELPYFDESIKVRYYQKIKEKYEESDAKFAFEQATHSGEWWKKYQDYLQTREWRQVRLIVLRRDELCQRCFYNRSVHAHHLTYATYNKYGFTFPCECVGVCEPCHDLIHTKEGQ